MSLLTLYRTGHAPVESLQACEWALTQQRRMRVEAEERIAELETALEEACDVAIWMSGSRDFGPEGEAGEAWPKQRERLYAAMDKRASVRVAAREETE